MEESDAKTGKKWLFQCVCVSIPPIRICRDGSSARETPGQAQAVSQGRGCTDTRDRHGSCQSDPGMLALPS